MIRDSCAAKVQFFAAKVHMFVFQLQLVLN